MVEPPVLQPAPAGKAIEGSPSRRPREAGALAVVVDHVGADGEFVELLVDDVHACPGVATKAIAARAQRALSPVNALPNRAGRGPTIDRARGAPGAPCGGLRFVRIRCELKKLYKQLVISLS